MACFGIAGIVSVGLGLGLGFGLWLELRLSHPANHVQPHG